MGQVRVALCACVWMPMAAGRHADDRQVLMHLLQTVTSACAPHVNTLTSGYHALQRVSLSLQMLSMCECCMQAEPSMRQGRCMWASSSGGSGTAAASGAARPRQQPPRLQAAAAAVVARRSGRRTWDSGLRACERAMGWQPMLTVAGERTRAAPQLWFD